MKKIAGKLIGGGIRIMDVTNIIAVHSNTHEQIIFLRNGDTVRIRQTLISLKEELEQGAPGQFISIGKSVVVNMMDIDAIYPDHIVLSNGNEFPLTKGSYRRIQKQVLAYLQTL